MADIRLATESDIDYLPEIERSAGEQFRAIGMPEIADDEPPTSEIYQEALAANQLWVAQIDSRVCAYGFATVLDNHGHLEQASVHAEFAGRGIGKALMLTMVQWAQAADFEKATLTTFADVPWNAPYYRTFGFEDLPEADIGPELAAVVKAERESDIGAWNRIVMVTKFER